ncbi:MAG: DUF554 domain-containing protein [Acholeplasmataceae bacterium]|jgi:uncharacterized membrane protein YqgA involved in biofilm formation|nr:DUF554 domain-containing protein [Acholeplasmataceae bacterium]
MGTLINAAAIIVATLIGVVLKKGLPDKIQKSVMMALGLGLITLSLGWFLKDFLTITDGVISTSHELLIIISLVVGALIGEWIDIDMRLNRWAENIEIKYKLPPLAKGFISATLIFCVGAMAIVGSIQDGVSGDYSILVIKSLLDFVTAMILASVLGIGVIFSAISVFIYQGAIFLLARQAEPLLTPEIIQSLSMVGNILLIAIGINFTEIKRIKVANLLPALLIPIIYYAILALT